MHAPVEIEFLGGALIGGEIGQGAGHGSEPENLGWRLESLENIINNTTDSLILGATIYFESVST